MSVAAPGYRVQVAGSSPGSLRHVAAHDVSYRSPARAARAWSWWRGPSTGMARARAPFLALNGAAIPENLLESARLGHEKGGLHRRRSAPIGKFEQVSGGTLFLDEIGGIPLALQAKILRAAGEAYERAGGNETIRTHVRLIAATNRELEDEAAHGRYRPGLHCGIQLRAARLRGITRRTLRLKLRELGLSVTKTVEAVEDDDAD